jgi:hypothetical protein
MTPRAGLRVVAVGSSSGNPTAMTAAICHDSGTPRIDFNAFAATSGPVIHAGIAQQIDRLTHTYLNAVMGLAEYHRRRRELEQRDQALGTQQRELHAQVDRHRELEGAVASVEEFCQRARQGLANATFEQKRELVELLIDRVIVSDDEVEIRYVVPTSSHGEVKRFCHLRCDYFNPKALGVRRFHHRDLIRARDEQPGFVLTRFPDPHEVQRELLGPRVSGHDDIALKAPAPALDQASRLLPAGVDPDARTGFDA